jgi:hypothetical protein
MIRTNGRVVEGHVEAPTPEEAYGALSDNGIVTESLRPDPRPEAAPPEPEEAAGEGGFRQAIDSALDSASMQVAFDSLTEQYRGKKVWVLDRDKIRKRVAQVVDQVLAEAQRKAETDQKTRELVQEAIKGMFADNRNIASERTAESIAAERAAQAAQAAERAAQAAADKVAAAAAAQITAAAAAMPKLPPPPQGKQLPPSEALEQQIQRLSGVVLSAEKALASIISAAARVGRGGGGGGPRRGGVSLGGGEKQNEVLLEIFKTNLALQRGVEGEILDVNAEAPEGAADGQGAPQPPSSNGESAPAGDAGTGDVAPLSFDDSDAPAGGEPDTAGGEGNAAEGRAG